MSGRPRKKRAPQGIERGLETQPAAKAWLHTVLPTLQTYCQIREELKTRFGINVSQAGLSSYYTRHAAEIMNAAPTALANTGQASCGAFEITVLAPGTERITVQVRPLVATRTGPDEITPER